MIALVHTPSPRPNRGTWRAHALTRRESLLASAPSSPHWTYTRLLSNVFLREASNYHLSYALAALLNNWNDGEYELGDYVAPRIQLRMADLRSLSIGVGGLPYADTRVQAAFRGQADLYPTGLAQSPKDTADDYARGHPFDDRFDWNTSPRRYTGGGDSGPSESWGVHRPERAFVARCACWRHNVALAVVATEAFSARPVTRACLRIWAEEERWKALARLLSGDDKAEDGQGAGEHVPVLLSRAEVAERVSFPFERADARPVSAMQSPTVSVLG